METESVTKEIREKVELLLSDADAVSKKLNMEESKNEKTRIRQESLEDSSRQTI